MPSLTCTAAAPTYKTPGQEFCDDSVTVGDLGLSARSVINVQLSGVDNAFTALPDEFREEWEAWSPQWLLSQQVGGCAACGTWLWVSSLGGVSQR